MGTTGASGIGIARHYAGHVYYGGGLSFAIFSEQAGIAGVTDPILMEPIDFAAERAERARTREPLPAPDTDLTNTDFGI